MLQNYLTVALRNLRRHALFSMINILGLAVGMACCFLILLFVHYELSFDQFHERADRILRVATERDFWGQELINSARSPETLAPALRESFPEIIQTVRLSPLDSSFRFLVRRENVVHFEENILMTTDPTFFEVFSFPLLKGDPKTALQDPRSVVISSAIARKYFGDQDPMGKTLKFLGNTHRVTGILKDLPKQSHFQFQLLVPLKRWYKNKSSPHASRMYTYILLDHNHSVDPFSKKLPDFVQNYPSALISKEKYKETTLKLHLQPLTQIHLHSHLKDELATNRDVRDLFLFSGIALVILAIACINFINLSTARSMHRIREIGLRKVVGAYRSHLIKQFMGEAFLLSFLSMSLALALTKPLLLVWNVHTGLSLDLNAQNSWFIWSGFLATTLCVGLLSGCYPAFYLSACQAVTILKGLNAFDGSGRLIRKGLVVFQFIVSIGFLTVIAVVHSQVQYMKTKDLGFHKDQVIVVSMYGIDERQIPEIRSGLSHHPDIIGITGVSRTPGVATYGPLPFEIDEQRKLDMQLLFVDYDFLSVMGIKLIAGRDFSPDLNDSKRALIVNRTAARQLSKKNPVGMTIRKSSYTGDEGTIIGVVEDFHFQSLHYRIAPMAIVIHPEHVISSGRFKGNRTQTASEIAVRISAGDVTEILEFMRQTWKTFATHYPMEYSFLDERVGSLYQTEARLAQTLAAFSALAVFISCLGLFGLASFTVERRTKEIGIRKVVGASVSGIVLLLSIDFVKLVLISSVIALPAAYWLMRDWLANFAYRIELGWEVFVLSGGTALLIAMLTVSFQAWKAARANPIDSLRYE